MNSQAINENIKVFVRMRPSTVQEAKAPPLYELGPQEVRIFASNTSQAKKYTFEKVLNEKSTQQDVYSAVVSPVIDLVLRGFNCTVFAYGQTGTGKTHTMIGDVPETIETASQEFLGMIPRAAMALFNKLEKTKRINDSVKYTVLVSFIEIYNEEVRDLLVTDGGPLRIYPGGESTVIIKDMSEKTVSDVNAVLGFLRTGLLERHTTSTNLNARSSRSHTVFTIYVQTLEVLKTGQTAVKNVKFNLVDLAGSENIGRSGATDIHAREAGTINKSLLTLAKVIKGLASKKPHIPYRESKLTRILQDSLGGGSTTCMIATISPSSRDRDETISTLEYAHIARYVSNTPTVNINISQNQLMRDTAKTLDKLRHDLEAARDGEGFYITHATYHDMQSSNQLYQRNIDEQLAEMNELNVELTNVVGDVKDTKQQMEELRATYKEQERILNKCNVKIEALTEISNRLLEGCATSTRYEDIYYRKYTNLSEKMAQNANIAKAIVTKSLANVRAIEQSKETFLQDLETIYDEAINHTAILHDDHKATLEFIKSNLIRLDDMSTFNEFGIDLEHIIENYFASAFDAMKKTIAEAASINATSKADFEQTLGKITEVAGKSATIVNDLQHCQKESLAEAKGRLDRSNQRIKLLEEALRLEREKNKILVALPSNIQQDMDSSTLLRDTITESFQQNGNKSEKSFSSLARNYVDDFARVDAQMTTLSHNLQDAATDLDVKLTQDRQKIEQSMAHLKSIIITQQNDMNKEMLDKLEEKSVEITELNENHKAHSLEASEIIKRFKYDVLGFIQRTSAEFEETFANVNWQVHVGDTPAKKHYKYPTNIKNGVILFGEQENSFSTDES